MHSKLYDVGLSWYKACTLKQGLKHIGTCFYLSGQIKHEQLEKVKVLFPGRVLQGVATSEYVPEQKRPIIVILTKAECKRRRAKAGGEHE